MAEVCSFRGIRYNQGIVGNLAQIICPPYDVITLEQQRLYHEKSSYNAIRLEYPLDVSCERSEATPNNKYDRAAITFQQWLKQGILQIDDCPAFYLHDHYFTYLRKERIRRGLIACVELEPWGSGIYPHEETFSKAKDDRLHLMRACQANFSPLLSLYQDSEQKIAPVLAEVAKGKPIMSLRAQRSNLINSNERHIVWAITDPKTRQQIGQFLSAQLLYIADGHHRYETALTYQQERTQCHSEPFASRHPEHSEEAPNVQGKLRKESQKEAFNYVMMELVEFSDPGLIILPIHRLVRGIVPSALTRLEKQLESFFTLEFVPLTESLLAPCHCERSEAISKVIGKAILGVLGLQASSLVVLKKRQDTSLEVMMPSNHPQAYKEFSISLLNHIILDKILGVEAGEEGIVYTVDVGEAYQQIKEGEYQLAFLSNPPQPETIKTIVDAKDRMPRKSTYFYPKLPTGLIINPLDWL